METEELNTQLAILKEKQRIAGADADKAAQKSLGMTEASRYKTEERESAYGGIETGAAYVTKDEELINAIEAYEEYKNKVDEANRALADMAETSNYTQKEWSEQEQIVSTYSEKMEDARSHANELASTLEEQKQGLTESTDASQALLNTVDSTIDKYNEWLNAINGTTVALQEQNEVEKKVADETIDFTPSISFNGLVAGIEKELKPVMDVIQDTWADACNSDGVFEIDPDNALDAVSKIKDSIESINNEEGLGTNIDTSSLEDLARVETNS